MRARVEGASIASDNIIYIHISQSGLRIIFKKNYKNFL